MMVEVEEDLEACHAWNFDGYLYYVSPYRAALPTALPAALPVRSPSLSAINAGTLPRSSKALTTPPPSQVGYQSSPPPTVLPDPPTTHSSLSGMATKAIRILRSSGQTHKQTLVTPLMQSTMVR
ncbi:hypothetical protein LWI28_003966 [Acer negundo]|uniref:Uncharacterized protein n=1 Tax=Acer negundo TaxID=4023 RepID=A0AAD5J982_ACENE|nr:hypothetical protein LWI28_003966 [Acer negundo]